MENRIVPKNAIESELKRGLNLVASCGCERTTHGWCGDGVENWSPHANEECLAWCHPCVAKATLEGVLPHPIEKIRETNPEINWINVFQIFPEEKKLVMVTGDSGHMTHKKFLCLAFRSFGIWLDVQNEPLTDMGWVPTHWADPIQLP